MINAEEARGLANIVIKRNKESYYKEAKEFINEVISCEIKVAAEKGEYSTVIGVGGPVSLELGEVILDLLEKQGFDCDITLYNQIPVSLFVRWK